MTVGIRYEATNFLDFEEENLWEDHTDASAIEVMQEICDELQEHADNGEVEVRFYDEERGHLIGSAWVDECGYDLMPE